MIDIEQTVKCSVCGKAVYNTNITGTRCAACYVGNYQVENKQVKNLALKYQQTIEAKDREIAMLRKQLTSMPRKLIKDECPACGCIGLHGCVGNRPDTFNDSSPRYEESLKLRLNNQQFWDGK